MAATNSTWYYKRWKDCEQQKRDYEEDLEKLQKLKGIVAETQSIENPVTRMLSGDVASTLASGLSGEKANKHQATISGLADQNTGIMNSLSDLMAQINDKITECNNKISNLQSQIIKWKNEYYDALEEEREAKGNQSNGGTYYTEK